MLLRGGGYGFADVDERGGVVAEQVEVEPDSRDDLESVLDGL
jgi:hypothetical protein